jgi:glycosyltransferase involved in cell wall biosynthesis
MQVVHLVPSVGPLSGGMGTAANEIMRAQRSVGLDATIWCVDPPRVVAQIGPGGAIVSLPVVGPRRFAHSPAGERRARSSRADILHQHGLWTAQSRITEAFRCRGVPTVVTPHGSLQAWALRHSRWKKRLAFAWFEGRNLRRASCLQATSDDEVRSLRNFGLRAPVALVTNGVTPEWLISQADPASFRHRHGIAAGRRILLFLSRLHAKKGLPLLLEAFSRHREKLADWDFVIAGTDADGHRAEIEALARRLGLSTSVHFIGPVYDEEKRGAFAAAELFVLPTHSENFGLVIAEALACGVPVITTHGAPWAELETLRCGWWVAIETTALGAALIDATRRRPEELREMGNRGRDLVAAKYVWPAVAERTVQLYNWLLGLTARPDFVIVD